MECLSMDESKVVEIANEDLAKEETKSIGHISNPEKTLLAKTSQTEPCSDPDEKTDDDCIDGKDLNYGGGVFVIFLVTFACIFTCFVYRDDWNLHLYIPERALAFGIVLILTSVFMFVAFYLYTHCMSEKLLRITLRDKLAAAQTEEFIRQMRTTNDDLAELALVQLDEHIRLMVGKNENILRRNSAESDEHIRMLASQNDQRIRLATAMAKERVRLLTAENDKYIKPAPNCDCRKASSENKNDESNLAQNDSAIADKELVEVNLNIIKEDEMSASLINQLLDESDYELDRATCETEEE